MWADHSARRRALNFGRDAQQLVHLRAAEDRLAEVVDDHVFRSRRATAVLPFTVRRLYTSVPALIGWSSTRFTETGVHSSGAWPLRTSRPSRSIGSQPRVRWPALFRATATPRQLRFRGAASSSGAGCPPPRGPPGAARPPCGGRTAPARHSSCRAWRGVSCPRPRARL
jgi:hypothetical protein